jgi:hypothetical protein
VICTNPPEKLAFVCEWATGQQLHGNGTPFYIDCLQERYYAVYAERSPRVSKQHGHLVAIRGANTMLLAYVVMDDLSMSSITRARAPIYEKGEQ